MKKFLVVVTPLAGLYREPAEPWHNYLHDDTQETQILYNELLLFKGEGAGWYYVEAPEQQAFTHHGRWGGYPGWVRAEFVHSLTFVPRYHVVVNKKVAPVLRNPSDPGQPLIALQAGTRLTKAGTRIEAQTRREVRRSRFGEQGSGSDDEEGESAYIHVELAGGGYGWVSGDAVRSIEERPDEAATRRGVIGTAQLFLGVPYLWGGRGVRGIDCSGLINLAFRVMGIDIPRNAHEQWMKARRISPADLRPGDLIFLSAEHDPDSITHVMLSTGGETFIEASKEAGTVRTGTFFQKLGMHFEDLKSQDFTARNRQVYLGSMIP